jgi:phytoene dehydrogenase-like protein
MMERMHLAKEDIKSNYDGGAYDLVIIGAGISGLSTGLMWLKNKGGKKTLILEKNPYPGGYVTAYERGGYVFETTQLFPDIVEILRYLGLEIGLKPYTGTFMRRLVVHDGTVEEYRIPAGSDNFTAYLCDVFPEDAGKIRKLMAYNVEMFAQVRKLKAIPTPLDMLATPFRAPKVIANLNRTYGELLDKFGIVNDRLREVLETFSSFTGVPASRAGAILTAGAMLSSMTRCFRPCGFFDSFPAAMTRLYQQWGGEVRLRAEVEKIIVDQGKVVGVKVKGDDGMIRAKRVVTTIDPMIAMRHLVGDDHLSPQYIEKLEGTVMSCSSLNVALGLDDTIDLAGMDLDYPYNVVSTGRGTTEKLFDGFLSGNNAFSPDCFHLALVCPSLTTGAKNTVTLRGVPFGMSDWSKWRNEDPARYKAEKERWGDFFVSIAEKYLIPGLSRHIVVRDIATPATYARYSGSPTGSIYDMAALVTQFGPKRLPIKTPIVNLFQPKFAHGLYGGMMNGVQVVDLMLDRSFNDGNSLFTPKTG